MDQALHDAHEAFQKRFQDLATQMRQIHEDWREAVRTHDLPRQSAPIAREHDLLTEVHEVIAAFQATIAQRYQ